jgi:hypothetical protein
VLCHCKDLLCRGHNAVEVLASRPASLLGQEGLQNYSARTKGRTHTGRTRCFTSMSPRRLKRKGQS